MSDRPRSVSAGVALIVFASVSFGFSGPLAKALINLQLSPLQVTWMRICGAALLLTAVAVPGLRTMGRPPFAGLIAFGLAAVAGVQAFYFLAVSRLPVGIALLLEFTGPVIVVAWIRWVRRTRLPRAAVIGALVSLAGLAVVVEVWSGLRLDALGLLAGAGAAACQAVYFLGGEKLTATVDVRVLLASGFVIGAIALTPIARPWTIDWTGLGNTAELGGLSLNGTTIAVVLVLSTVVAYLAGIGALKRLSAPVTGGMAYLEVVVAGLAAWVLLGEALTAPQIIGGVIVIAGVLTAQRAVSAVDVNVAPEPALER